MRDVKVMVGVLAGEHMVQCSLLGLFYALPLLGANPSNPYKFMPCIVEGTKPQEYARNELIGHALESGADVLVMIDHDMIMRDGGGTLLALLNTPDYDIAAPLQYMFHISAESLDGDKLAPMIYPCAMKLDPGRPYGNQAFVVHPNGDKVSDVDAVGSGMIAITRRVLEDERMRVQPDMTPPAVFRNVYEANGKRTRGLDVDFCARATELGYRVRCNWEAETGHFKRVDLFEMELYSQMKYANGLRQRGEHTAVDLKEAG